MGGCGEQHAATIRGAAWLRRATSGLQVRHHAGSFPVRAGILHGVPGLLSVPCRAHCRALEEFVSFVLQSSTNAPPWSARARGTPQ